LFGFLRGDAQGGRAGTELTVEHHVAPAVALFGTGSIGHRWGGAGRGLDWEALLGLRARW